MKCVLCNEYELSIHTSLEPQFDMTRERVEVVLPSIIAISCKGGCLYPVGGVLFKTISLIYWSGARHVEQIEIIRAHATAELEKENRKYLADLGLLTATLQEAVRREQGGVYHPTG